MCASAALLVVGGRGSRLLCGTGAARARHPPRRPVSSAAFQRRAADTDGRLLARAAPVQQRRRGVCSFLSPLGAAFNTRLAEAANKFWPMSAVSRRERTGLLGFPELTSPEGFGALEADCVRRAAELVTEATDRPIGQGGKRRRLVARVFDDLSDELCRVADMAEFVRQAHPDARYAQAAESTCINISGLVEQLNTHVGLYESLRRAVECGDDFPETDVDRHVAKLFLLDFKQSGIHLPSSERDACVRLNDEILQLGQQFAANAHRPRIVPSRELPADLRGRLASHDGGRTVVVSGLQQESADESLREASFKIFYWSDPEQERLLSSLVAKRHDLARRCGHQTFAHRATAESLAQTPENVQLFLTQLSSDLRARVDADYEEMLTLKRRIRPNAASVDPWDVPYFSAQAKSAWSSHRADADHVAEHFSLGVCMEGLGKIFRALFGVEMQVETAAAGELWHADVYKLCVRDGGGDELGTVYCDFFARPGKPFQDCHFTVRGGRRTADGGYQNPVVVLMLNLPPGGWTRPPLLPMALVDNLFHEMGHAMHSMLARTEYQHVTGTRCSTDFAEVPSTLMEFFASDASVLQEIGRHFSTGAALPAELAAQASAAKHTFSSVDIHTQLFHSLLDQTLHSGLSLGGPDGASPTSVLARAHADHPCLAYHADTAWHHRFSHLVGYGARYYSYLLARAVAAQIWRELFAEDPWSRAGGERLRRDCLAHGGGTPSHLLVADLLGGQRVRPTTLADALVAEVDRKNELVKRVLRR